MSKELETIFWDFDGVIMDSMPVRNKGFVDVLKDFPENEVQQLMDFHLKNGGLSRYVKFRFFFEEIRNESITEDEVKEWAAKFSKIMLENLAKPSLLINETVDFVKSNYTKYEMHIVSGSDGVELRQLCTEVGISKYFKSIHGSPTPKTELVQNLISELKLDLEKCVLIGDSVNDYDAATKNEISFIGYNDVEVEKLTNTENIF